MISINSLPNDKFFDLSQLKAFSDEKMNVIETLKFALGRVENIMGKGENAPFPLMFSKGFFLRVIKSRDCVVKICTVNM